MTRTDSFSAAGGGEPLPLEHETQPVRPVCLVGRVGPSTTVRPSRFTTTVIGRPPEPEMIRGMSGASTGLPVDRDDPVPD